MIPPRCFTCGRILPPDMDVKFDYFRKLGYTDTDILNMFGIKDGCCRLILITSVTSDTELEYTSNELKKRIES